MAKSEEELKQRLTESVRTIYTQFHDGIEANLPSSEFVQVYKEEMDFIMQAIQTYTATVAAEAARSVERKGEIAQLKMLKRWAVLHNIDITVDDINHILASLEQLPDQPLASETLDALNTTQSEEHDPTPPQDCTCGALWTVRGEHGKSDCPYAQQKEEEK